MTITDEELATIHLIAAGSDYTNFRILKLLPSSINEISKKLCFHSSSLNNRVNRLEYFGLVERDRTKGTISLSQFGSYFLNTVTLIGTKSKLYI